MVFVCLMRRSQDKPHHILSALLITGDKEVKRVRGDLVKWYALNDLQSWTFGNEGLRGI